MKNLTQFSDKTTETLINRNKGIQTTTDKWKIIREKRYETDDSRTHRLHNNGISNYHHNNVLY